MYALSAVELLNVWERGLAQSPAQRALTLLGAACPDIPSDSLTKMSVGDRDARLTALRERTFGHQLTCIANCATCGEQLDLTLDTGDLPASKEASSEDFSLAVEDYALSFRLPNSADLAALTGCESVADGTHLLLERCITSAMHQGKSTTSNKLPPTALAALVERMSDIDRSGDVQLHLTCPHCGHDSQALFDIESYFWKEINAWANRILREVHTLASTYGWSEIEILSMTTWRRQNYLNLIGA